MSDGSICAELVSLQVIARDDQKAERQEANQLPVVLRSLQIPCGRLLTFLHDQTVHHRGQLSSFAREMGSKISMLKGRNGERVSITQPAMKYRGPRGIRRTRSW